MKVALLPAGHDPDTFLRAEGAAAFTERIGGARSLLSYALDRAVGEAAAGGAAGPRQRLRAGGAHAGQGRRRRRRRPRWRARPRSSSASTPPSSGSRPSGCRPRCAGRRAVAGTATTTPAPPVPSSATWSGSCWPRARPGRALLPLLDAGEVGHAGLREVVRGARAARPEATPEQLMTELATDAARHALSALLVDERPLGDETARGRAVPAALTRARTVGRLRSVSQAVAEGQQRASSAVPMDATLVAELQQQGAVLHELVGGAAQSLNVPAVESRPDPSGPQGVHTHE